MTAKTRNLKMNKKGTLYVISGPSGVGKGTICRELLKRNPQLSLSVSATTRPMREEDTEGVTYFFKTENEFKSMIENNQLLEWATYNGNYYGTPVEPVNKALESGKDIILEIEVCGALNVRSLVPDAMLIFIDTPSVEELEKRLIGRGSETPESIKARIELAKEELKLKDNYDRIVVNNDLQTAILEIENIITEGE
ncbi:MAG: guanylate kinase [Ruminococcaceae bacterium]|nr:guanylate kinase [Oscillospiraceae bacterium]